MFTGKKRLTILEINWIVKLWCITGILLTVLDL